MRKYAFLKEPLKYEGRAPVYKVMLYEEDDGAYLFEYSSPDAVLCSADLFYESTAELYEDWNDLIDERGWTGIGDPLPGCQHDAFIPIRVKGRDTGHPEWGKYETLKDGEWVEYRTHKIGISSFAYSFACGNRPFQKPEHLLTPFGLIDKAVTVGAEVVQFGDNMPLEVYSDEELENIRAYACERGIDLEAGMRKASAERLSDHIRIARKLGARVLRVITDGADHAPDLQECCRIFASVIPQLEESGVVLGIENHDRFRAHEYAQMMETVAHPQIGLTVDTVNSLSIEEPLDEVLRYMAPYCVCLHMKDYVIRRNNGGGGLKIMGACPGTGRLDIRRCYEECSRRSGSSFNIILESWMEPCGTLEETLRMEDEWAAEGVRFLKKVID